MRSTLLAVDVRVADHDVVPLAGVDHPRHPFEHLGVLVLAGIAELLGEIALADEDGADAGHLLQDVGQGFWMPTVSSIIRITKISPLGLSGQTSARS